MNRQVSDYKLQEWAKIIATANNSGMSREEFFEQSGITRDAFYYWQRKVQKWIVNQQSNSLECAMQPASQSLVEVPVTKPDTLAPSTFQATAIIRIGSVTIEISPSATPEFMESIGRMIHNAL